MYIIYNQHHQKDYYQLNLLISELTDQNVTSSSHSLLFLRCCCRCFKILIFIFTPAYHLQLHHRRPVVETPSIIQLGNFTHVEKISLSLDPKAMTWRTFFFPFQCPIFEFMKYYIVGRGQGCNKALKNAAGSASSCRRG